MPEVILPGDLNLPSILLLASDKPQQIIGKHLGNLIATFEADNLKYGLLNINHEITYRNGGSICIALSALGFYGDCHVVIC